MRMRVRLCGCGTAAVAMAAWPASRRGMLGWDGHNDEFRRGENGGNLTSGKVPFEKTL